MQFFLQIFALTGQFQKVIRGYKSVTSIRINPNKEEEGAEKPSVHYNLVIVEAKSHTLSLLQ
jgi:hypothetical protein